MSLIAVVTTDDEPEVRVVQTPGQATDTSLPLPTTALEPAPTLPSTTTTIPPRRTAAFPDEEVYAFIWEGDLWISGRNSGRVVQVTNDAYARTEASPELREPSRLTFVSAPDGSGRSTLEELDLTTGTHRIVTVLAGLARDADWSPDGSTLAYLSWDDSQRVQVRASSPGAGTDAVRRELGVILGRGADPRYDQTRLDWSADGTKLLVVDTADKPGGLPPLLVLRPDGTDVVPPRQGSWVDWAPDSRTVFFVPDPIEHRVVALDTETGREMPIPTPGPVRRLAVSPDGRFLTYDDGEPVPTVFELDLTTRTGRAVREEAVAPIWLSADTLLVGHAARCVPVGSDDCDAGGHRPKWSEQGRAWRIGRDGGASLVSGLKSTLDMALVTR